MSSADAEEEEVWTRCERCAPHRPSEPSASDCCGSGCDPCVFDLYETGLAGWRKTCRRHHADGVGAKHQEHVGHQLQGTSSQSDVLSLDEYRSFKLQRIERVSKDTATYTFALPENRRLNCGIGQHIILRCCLDGRPITRQYTPISPADRWNSFDVLIKVYQGGPMSSYVKQWTEGDSIEWRGPYGDFTYKPNQYRKILMLAAGTGVAPMLQVIRRIVTSDEEETFVRLLYACRTYEDLLLRETLNEFTAYWNFTVLYSLSRDRPGDHPTSYGETFHYGRINPEMLATETETSTEKDTQVLVCGTKSFEKDMLNFLKKLDFKGDVHKF